MARKGVKVRALQERPRLNPIEDFYYDLYDITGGSIAVLMQVAACYGLEGNELFDAILVMRAIR
jgi:hypothetical protein